MPSARYEFHLVEQALNSMRKWLVAPQTLRLLLCLSAISLSFARSLWVGLPSCHLPAAASLLFLTQVHFLSSVCL